MDAINALLDRIRTQGIGASAEINPFWRRLVESFAPVLDSGERVSASALNKALGYGAARLPAGVASNRDMPIWAELMRAADTGEVGGLGKQIEHAAILRFLREKEVLDDYVATLDRFRLVSNLGTGRLYWYAVRLSRLLRRRGGDAPRVFLEIGSGAGFFAMLMSDAGLVRHYVMVDLPEMLLNAMLHARDYLPGVQIRFGETPDFSRSEQTFWFLETSEVARVPDRSVEVALNFNSFMEMDEAIRDSYIDQIYRTAAPGALFYNVNRRQKAMTRQDGRKFENNPLLYPYRPSDRILEWQTDECQESCRSELFRSPHTSFSISRIAQIGPAS